MEERVIKRWDDKLNPIFEVGSKRIFFDLAALRPLVKKAITINNTNERFVWGQAWGSGLDLNFSGLIQSGRNNPSIKRIVTETLAHEVRHTFQTKAGFIDKLALRLCPFLTYFSILSVLTAIGGFILSPALWILTIISSLPPFIYFFSPREKDARGFARLALKNEEWLKVVKVEDIDTP